MLQDKPAKNLEAINFPAPLQFKILFYFILFFSFGLSLTILQGLHNSERSFFSIKVDINLFKRH